MRPPELYRQRRQVFVEALKNNALNIDIIKRTLVAAVRAGKWAERDFDKLFEQIFVVYEDLKHE
ncbi:hypothetical protein DSCA_60070 [Desulfosarcina alkanivorans]|uniref:Uncharacterized protein n=1 Tax=Desulfosarcina alkanivorans TaxID=571177 RepID=A0A5K7Z672_9BACT|nr:hypothetical protein DSCA_60070 [Desulfosarcina alkanivorans]